eukprot:3781463-Amphidinium_carterae.1
MSFRSESNFPTKCRKQASNIRYNLWLQARLRLGVAMLYSTTTCEAALDFARAELISSARRRLQLAARMHCMKIMTMRTMYGDTVYLK